MGIDIKIDVAEILRSIEHTVDRRWKEARKEKEDAAALFRKTADKIYRNLSTLQTLKLDDYRTLPINAPKVQKIARKLQISYSEQFIAYSRRIPRLKGKEKDALTARLSLARYKMKNPGASS
jgi:hypothetical protein